MTSRERHQSPLRRRAAEVLTVLPAAGLLLVRWGQDAPRILGLRDWGAYAYLGEQLLHGKLPIRDIWDQKPGAIAGVDAVALAFGGDPVRDLHALDLAYSLLILIAARWLLRAVAGRLATAAALLFLVALYRNQDYLQFGNLTEQYALLPMFIALGCAVRCLRGGHGAPALALACGLLAGIAACFKPTAATPAAALAATLLVGGLRGNRDQLRGAVLPLAGALIPPLLLIAGYVAAGTPLHLIYEDLVLYNARYGAGHDETWARQAVVACALHWEVLVPPLLLLVRFLLRAPARVETPLFLLVAVGVGADLVGLIVPGWFYGHYFMLLLPSATLALACSAGSFPPRPEVITRFARAEAVGLAGVVVLAYLVSYLSLQSPAASFRPPIARLDSYCRPGQPIWVWGNEPQVFVLSGHPSASRYLYLAPLQLHDYQNQRRAGELISDLSAASPCAVVDASSTSGGLAPPLDPVARASWRPPLDPRYTYTRLDDVYRYMQAHFRQAEPIGDWTVWVPT